MPTARALLRSLIKLEIKFFKLKRPRPARRREGRCAYPASAVCTSISPPGRGLRSPGTHLGCVAGAYQARRGPTSQSTTSPTVNRAIAMSACLGAGRGCVPAAYPVCVPPTVYQGPVRTRSRLRATHSCSLLGPCVAHRVPCSLLRTLFASGSRASGLGAYLTQPHLRP
jgi:hypothetical protein